MTGSYSLLFFGEQKKQETWNNLICRNGTKTKNMAAV